MGQPTRAQRGEDRGRRHRGGREGNQSRLNGRDSVKEPGAKADGTVVTTVDEELASN